MSNVNPRAVQAREGARQSDGKFGSYQLVDAGVDADLDNPITQQVWDEQNAAFEAHMDAQSAAEDKLIVKSDRQTNKVAALLGRQTMQYDGSPVFSIESDQGVLSWNLPSVDGSEAGKWGFEAVDGDYVVSNFDLDSDPRQVAAWAMEQGMTKSHAGVEGEIMTDLAIAEAVVSANQCGDGISDSTAKSIAAQWHGGTDVQITRLSHGKDFEPAALAAEARRLGEGASMMRDKNNLRALANWADNHAAPPVEKPAPRHPAPVPMRAHASVKDFIRFQASHMNPIKPEEREQAGYYNAIAQQMDTHATLDESEKWLKKSLAEPHVSPAAKVVTVSVLRRIEQAHTGEQPVLGARETTCTAVMEGLVRAKTPEDHPQHEIDKGFADTMQARAIYLAAPNATGSEVLRLAQVQADAIKGAPKGLSDYDKAQIAYDAVREAAGNPKVTQGDYDARAAKLLANHRAQKWENTGRDYGTRKANAATVANLMAPEADYSKRMQLTDDMQRVMDAPADYPEDPETSLRVAMARIEGILGR